MRFPPAFLTAAALLSGCASAPTVIYTLDPAPPASGAIAAAYAGPPVRVDAVHVPPAMDRPELVTTAGAERLQVHDLAHWAAPLGDLARRALAADLQARLPRGALIYPGSPKPQAARSLVVDLLTVAPAAGGATVADASWTLLPAVRGGPMRQRQVRLSTPSSAGPGGLAADLSALMGQLADAIAADLAAAPPPTAVPTASGARVR